MSRLPSKSLLAVWLLPAMVAFAPVLGAPYLSVGEITGTLSHRYGIELVVGGAGFPVKTTHGAIDGAEAAPADVNSYVELLGAEWNLYPPGLVRRTGLRRIILCRDLTFAGQKRTAIPDFEHHDLYFDIARGRHNPTYVRKVIHHEYFHIIDWLDDHHLYEDGIWSALNGPGFRYGSGGVNAQDDANMARLDDSLPGFLNRYAMTGVEEDKAEVFANLIVSGAYVDARCRQDPVLRDKVLRLKALVWRYCPEMAVDFWSRATRLPRAATVGAGAGPPAH